MLRDELGAQLKQPEKGLLSEEGIAPPVALCVRCGLTFCAGCAALAPLSPDSTLPWEGSARHWLIRLWQTALATSVEPQKFFGELPLGRVAPALGFALLAEAVALGSVALLAGAALQLCAPEFTRLLLASTEARRSFGALWVGSVLLMVVLHTLWGLCLDLGAGRRTRSQSWAQGLRFGLYACGWDLLTSPAGALSALVARGPLGAWAPIAAAARAPMLAQRAYLEVCRGFGVEERRRAVRLSMFVIGAALLLVVLCLVGALILLARHFGY
jgi:hypothetical protein